MQPLREIQDTTPAAPPVEASGIQTEALGLLNQFPESASSGQNASQRMESTGLLPTLLVQASDRPSESRSNRADSGDNRTSSGDNRTSSGDNRTSSGDNRTSSGDNRTSSGDNRTSSGDNRTSSGDNRTNTGDNRADSPTRPNPGALSLDINRQIQTLSNSRSGTGYSADVNRALRGMVEQHGEDRFRQMIDTLDKLSPSGHAAFRHELRQDFTQTPEATERLNQRLRNLDWLCKPENLETVRDLNETMREEGYTQMMSLSDLNFRTIEMLVNDPEERKAFIEFNNEARNSMQPGFFLKENPQMSNETPANQLRHYRQWQANRP